MFSKEYKAHYKENLKVAWPVILGQLGHMMATIADNTMVGQINSIQLAACSFANAVFFVIFIFGIGLAMGVTPIVGKAFGGGDIEKCKSILKSGLLVNIITAIIITILLIIASFYFDSFGQDKRVVKYAVPFFRIIAASMIPYMIFLSFKQFTDALSLTKPGMIILIICNLLNVVINYLLIYGNFGFPRLEIEGAGWATLIARICMAISMILLFLYNKNLKQYLKGWSRRKFNIEHIKEVLNVGVPIGLQYVLEVAAFASGAFIIGWVGAIELAAHQIAITVASVTFMIATGLASAATIRMSNFIGKKSFRDMKVAGNSAFIMVIAFMSFTAIIFFLFGHQLASFYVKEEVVIVIAVKLLIIAAFFQLADGIQAIGLGTLRGVEDVKIPTIITTINYWFITIPLCYYLGIKLQWGAAGVWYGYLIGLSLVSIALFIRYEYITKKIVKDNLVMVE